MFLILEQMGGEMWGQLTDNTSSLGAICVCQHGSTLHRKGWTTPHRKGMSRVREHPAQKRDEPRVGAPCTERGWAAHRSTRTERGWPEHGSTGPPGWLRATSWNLNMQLKYIWWHQMVWWGENWTKQRRRLISTTACVIFIRKFSLSCDLVERQLLLQKDLALSPRLAAVCGFRQSFNTWLWVH